MDETNTKLDTACTQAGEYKSRNVALKTKDEVIRKIDRAPRRGAIVSNLQVIYYYLNKSNRY